MILTLHVLIFMKYYNLDENNLNESCSCTNLWDRITQIFPLLKEKIKNTLKLFSWTFREFKQLFFCYSDTSGTFYSVRNLPQQKRWFNQTPSEKQGTEAVLNASKYKLKTQQKLHRSRWAQEHKSKSPQKSNPSTETRDFTKTVTSSPAEETQNTKKLVQNHHKVSNIPAKTF